MLSKSDQAFNQKLPEPINVAPEDVVHGGIVADIEMLKI